MKHQQLSRANGTKRPFLLALIAFSLGFCHYAEAKVQPTEAFTSNVDSLIINDNNKDKDETIYEAVDEIKTVLSGDQSLKIVRFVFMNPIMVSIHLLKHISKR